MFKEAASVGVSHPASYEVSMTLPAVPSNSERKDSEAGGEEGAGVDTIGGGVGSWPCRPEAEPDADFDMSESRPPLPWRGRREVGELLARAGGVELKV